MLLSPTLSQPVCSPRSNCICNPGHVELLRQNNWIVVPWDTGQCYFHNFVTREDRDTLPKFLEVGMGRIRKRNAAF